MFLRISFLIFKMLNNYNVVVVFHLLSCIQLFVTPWAAACHAPLSFTISWSLLKFISIESVMLSNHFILWHPLFPLLSIYSIIRLFTNELALPIKWPKYWSFSFSISPYNKYSGLIFFRIDWFDLLAVQGTQESSPAPHFESINSLVLKLLYDPTLIFVHDYWKKL